MAVSRHFSFWPFLANFIVCIVSLPTWQVFGDTLNSDQMYDNMFADSRLDMTIAVGFDEIDGHSRPLPSEVPLLGPLFNEIQAGALNVSQHKEDVDNISSAISGCAECKFKKSHSGAGFRIYESSLEYKGRPVSVRLRLIYNEDGVAPEKIKARFRSSTQGDDAVIYLGHSRHGSGFPDFGPSSKTQGKVFVKNSFDGSWKGFDKKNFSPDKYQLLFLDSCKSREYFEKVLRTHVTEKKIHDLGLILTNADSFWDDYPDTAMALVRGLMLRQPPKQILAAMEEASPHRDHLTSSGPLYFSSEVPTDIMPEKIEASAMQPKSVSIASGDPAQDTVPALAMTPAN